MNNEFANIKNKYSKEIEKAIYIRQFEGKLLNLFSKGMINGTVHTCVGQEFSGVFVSKFLKKNDLVVSNHRGHGHYLSATGDYRGLLAEMMGKKTGVSGGYGGSQHLINDNFLSNGIQGGMTPVAAGIALNKKIKKRDDIVVVFIGDGTLGEGIIYETMNICSLWNLPIVFILENNGYAQSTSNKQTISGDIESRITGFGLDYLKTNMWDLENLNNSIYTAFTHAREGKPSFVEIECYRLNSHSKGDDNRSASEVLEYVKKDFINTYIEEYPNEYQALVKLIDEELESLYLKIDEDENLEKS